ncbi:MAG: methyltransferase domain-containing protein [Acidobacteriia bacterium]|nr:methyltransferase domain-containing protein [Terriglobia bacterium]
MADFTGERVIPGQVDQDLWNEHLARYLFAARLSGRKRVLDLACGTGYGSAELAQSAESVVALDSSHEAVQYASANYQRQNLRFLQASCTEVPLADFSIDLVVAFEVIEHLPDWPVLIQEARRLLAPGGQFIVSTPNKSYYAESRRQSGANPFHEYEFEFEEFQEALKSIFPHVSMFLQNHSYGVTFQPLTGSSSAEVRLQASAPDCNHSHFFLAVCAMGPQTGAPTYVYLPTTANVLREREQHIAMLEEELAQKNAWLEKSQNDHRILVEDHRKLVQEVEQRNRWAEQLNVQLSESGARVRQLQEELVAEQKAALDNAALYELKIAELDRESAARAQWAIDTETRLTAELKANAEELAQCVALLDKAEKTVEERTLWAQSLESQRVDLETKLSMVQGSRWYRMGRRFGLGPQMDNS